MKTLAPIIFCISLLLIACGSKKSADEEKEKTENKDELSEEDVESTEFEEAKNCDEFIDNYEKWMDAYLEFIEKYTKNPMDATLSEEYMKLVQESTNWTTEWSTKLVFCASQEKYEKRYEEISERAEKKLKELGLE